MNKSGRCEIIGIVNVTPDSFSDGGRMGRDAVDQAMALWREGANWLDVGGESTRPGASYVTLEEEMERVMPVIKSLKELCPEACISVDTRRAIVAAAALDAGALMINDVSGGKDTEMFGVVKKHASNIVLMHSRGTPENMMDFAVYGDVVAEVWEELFEKRELAIRSGISADKIFLDPGIGFAKNADQNLQLLRHLSPYCQQNNVLLGASRKSFIGVITEERVAAKRLEGSLGVALWAENAGVRMLRVHDVAATRKALAIWRAISLGTDYSSNVLA